MDGLENLNQNKMKKYFVPYDLALELKELGFDEPCFFAFDNTPMRCSDLRTVEQRFNGVNYNSSSYISQPTFSQAFRWFREEYGFEVFLQKEVNLVSGKTYSYLIENDVEEIIKRSPSKSSIERAELACIEKLLEIVKSKS